MTGYKTIISWTDVLPTIYQPIGCPVWCYRRPCRQRSGDIPSMPVWTYGVLQRRWPGRGLKWVSARRRRQRPADGAEWKADVLRLLKFNLTNRLCRAGTASLHRRRRSPCGAAGPPPALHRTGRQTLTTAGHQRIGTEPTARPAYGIFVFWRCCRVSIYQTFYSVCFFIYI